MFPRPLAEAPSQVPVGEQHLERSAERLDVARRHRQARLAVDDQVAEPADVACDDRTPVRHRLRAGDAEAFAV